MNQVYTMASAFITSCPASNPPLPVKAFPTLAVPPTASGKRARLTFKAVPGDRKDLFAAFISGMGTTFVPVNEKKEVVVPEGLIGLVFVIITSDSGMVTDETMVAGPAMLQFMFDSQGKVY